MGMIKKKKLMSSYISKSSPIHEFSMVTLKRSILWCFWVLMVVLSVLRLFNWILPWLLCNNITPGKDPLKHFFPELFSVQKTVVQTSHWRVQQVILPLQSFSQAIDLLLSMFTLKSHWR